MTPRQPRSTSSASAAAPWLAAGLAAARARRLGRARPSRSSCSRRSCSRCAAAGSAPLRSRGRRRLRARSARPGRLHGIAARAADPLRARIGHVERRARSSSRASRGPARSAAPRSRDSTAIRSSCARAAPLRAGRDRRGQRHASRRCRRPTGGFDRRTWLARQGVHETLAGRSLAVLGRRGGIQGVLDRLRRGARAALQAGGDDEVEPHRDGRRARRHRGARRRHGRGVPRLGARPPAGRLGRQRRAARRGRARPGLARRHAARARARLRDPGGRRLRGDRRRRAVGRARGRHRRAGVAGLAGRLGTRSLASARARGGRACSRSTRGRSSGPGFQLSFVAVAAIHGLAPPIRGWLEGTPVPLRAVQPARDLARLHARHRAGRAGAFRPHVARRQPAREPARAAGRRAAAVARARGLRRSGRSRPGRRSLLDARRARARRLHRPRRAPRRLARRRACPGVRCSSRSLGGGAGVARCRRRRAAAFAGALAGLLLALAWPSARASPPPPRALRVTFLDVGQGDAALIEAPGLRALVDTGPPDARVERLLRQPRRHVARRAAPLARPDSTTTAAPRRSCASCAWHCSSHRRSPGTARAWSSAVDRGARARGTRVLRGRAGLVLRSGAVELRVVGPLHATRGDDRRTTPRSSSWRGRGRARSCCRPTPSRRCC